MRITRSRPGGVEVVAWSARAGRWWRWAAPLAVRATDLQEAWLASYQLQGNEPGTVEALAGVQKQQLYAFVGSAWSYAKSTGNVSAAQPSVTLLPDGLRLVLTLEGGPFVGTLQRSVQIVHP